MLILHTYGFPFIIEAIKEITYKELESSKGITVADGSCSQYPNEENNDLIYVGF